MMSIDQMELLFQMLILQNSDRKVIDVFPSYNGKETTFGQCEIKRDVHGKRGEPLFLSLLILQSVSSGIVIFRVWSVTKFSKPLAQIQEKQDFITWKEGKPIENEFEPFYKHLLNFVSFEDKI